MRKILLLLISIHLGVSALAISFIQPKYYEEFSAAYTAYPNIPQGLLEAVAQTQSRMTHISGNNQSCTGIPQVKGVMGLTEDGQGFFKDNLAFSAEISGISIHDIKTSAAQNIMAYAAAYSHVLETSGLDVENWKTHEYVLMSLSEIPLDGNPTNYFAVCSFTYEVFRWMNKASFQSTYLFDDPDIDLEAIYGAENLAILSSDKIVVQEEGVSTESGDLFEDRTDEYGPALWVATPSCNYSSRSGTAISAVTIHTIQGSYSGAISWATNCDANVSYHYVVRSSDGQVTQMLLEEDKGWHVGSENPYTIGIEHEGYVDDAAWYTNEMYTSSADLVRDITESGYGINPLRTFQGPATAGVNVLGACVRIKGHQHFPGGTHTDPGINWNWEYYYQLLNDDPDITTYTASSGSLFDSGGAGADYEDDERFLYLIQPTSAVNITLDILSFSLEEDWDYLRIYDGASLSDPLIGAFTGTDIPTTISSTGGSILLEFRSDCATTDAGWEVQWSSTTGPAPGDVIPPVTDVFYSGEWITDDFSANFTDTDDIDGTGVKHRFVQVIDFDGLEWRANSDEGFFSDNFDFAIHPDWTSETGSWGIASEVLVQSDEANGNTNLHALVNQDDYDAYLYHWGMSIDGSGTNKRGGFHFMCDDPTLPNRGNSYFVWFRSDDNKVQIYKVVDDVFSLEADVSHTINDDQWYDIKTVFDKDEGSIQVWVNNEYVASWTDPDPHLTGNSISLRSGNSNFELNNLKIYRNRSLSETVTIGPLAMIRYQNQSPIIPSGKVKSIAIDSSANVSSISSEFVNVDWTPPAVVSYVYDGEGADISTTGTNTELSANWDETVDPHSDIARYWYAIGTTPEATDVVDWTDNWFETNVTHTGLELTYGTTYYISVFAENGAGLNSDIMVSDGQTLVTPTDPPIAEFSVYGTFICDSDSIQLENSSTDAVTYAWSVPGAIPESSEAVNPYFTFPSSGTYEITLVATGPGGTDTDVQTINVEVDPAPVADFEQSESIIPLSDPSLTFTNNSLNADGYLWDFGDGTTSTDSDPWHEYEAEGTYEIMLVAINGTCPNDTLWSSVLVTASIGLDELENEFVIYPNPAQDQIELRFGDAYQQPLKIEIIDERGRIVFEKQFLSIQNTIPLGLPSTLSSGVYILRLSNELDCFDKKLIVQH